MRRYRIYWDEQDPQDPGLALDVWDDEYNLLSSVWADTYAEAVGVCLDAGARGLADIDLTGIEEGEELRRIADRLQSPSHGDYLGEPSISMLDDGRARDDVLVAAVDRTVDAVWLAEAADIAERSQTRTMADVLVDSMVAACVRMWDAGNGAVIVPRDAAVLAGTIMDLTLQLVAQWQQYLADVAADYMEGE